MTCRSLSQMTWSRNPMIFRPPRIPDTGVSDHYTLSSGEPPGQRRGSSTRRGGTTMAVGVIGLGNIGGFIAANLVADGNEVVVHDLDPAAVQAVTGATAAPDAAEVGRQADITFLSLPTPDVVAAVAEAWASAADPGSILVDLSTNSP